MAGGESGLSGGRPQAPRPADPKAEAQDKEAEEQTIIDGEVIVPEGPGLGVELDEDKLKKWGRPLKVEE